MSWQPCSPCGPGCLPRPGVIPSRARPAALARLSGVGAVLFAGLGLAAVLPLLAPAARERLLRGWFRAVLRVLGVAVRPRGSGRLRPATGGVLVVANHTSWLDVIALGAVHPLRLVAKREIRGWPLFGAMAARIGTVFVDRARLRTLPGTVVELAAALRSGAVVGVFAEGTTWCGLTSGTFRPAAFQAALDAGVPVRPVALRYVLADGRPTTAAAFVGAETLGHSIWRIARLRGLAVEVHARPLIRPAAGLDRRTLARATCRSVRMATVGLGTDRSTGSRSSPVHPLVAAG